MSVHIIYYASPIVRMVLKAFFFPCSYHLYKRYQYRKQSYHISASYGYNVLLLAAQIPTHVEIFDIIFGFQ